ncbi:phospholipase [bacterium]|nr:phospholipase [bacterium]
MKNKAIVLVSLLVVTGCQPPPKFQTMTRNLDVSGSQRSYRIVLPEDLPANAPLIIAWHGVGDTAESMAKYSQLDELAAEQRFVLVYPDANQKLWQVPRAEIPDKPAMRDVEFFDRIVKDVSDRQSIDQDRIYVAGMSQGATFVHWLIACRSDQIAAAVAHSGSPPQPLKLTGMRPPILQIVGNEDNARNGVVEASEAYQTSGIECQLVEVPSLGHRWATSQNERIWGFLKDRRRKANAGSE